MPDRTSPERPAERPPTRIRPTASAFAVALFSITKIFGGAAILWSLGAPGWAIGAWLMLHLRLKLDLTKRAA